MDARPTGTATRPTEDESMLAIAEARASRGTCLRGRVGAVVTDRDGHIVATGYNGSPSGAPHCSDDGVGCLMVEGHCRRTIHAEANALYNAADRGLADRLAGSTVYVTHSPCIGCAVLLVRARVRRVVYRGAYGSTTSDAIAYLRSHGVVVDGPALP